MKYACLGTTLVWYDWCVIRVVVVAESSTFRAAMVQVLHHPRVLLLLLRQSLSFGLLYTSVEVISSCWCLLTLVKKRDDHLI